MSHEERKAGLTTTYTSMSAREGPPELHEQRREEFVRNWPGTTSFLRSTDYP